MAHQAKRAATAVREDRRYETPAGPSRPLEPMGPPRAATLDTKLASNMLALNTYAAQRAMKPPHVNRLVGKIENGLFHTANISIAVLPDGTKVLMNGQHCCLAVLSSKTSVPATVTEFRCRDTADLASLFAQYDTSVATRTLGDILNAYVAGTELDKYPLKVIRFCVDSLVFLRDPSMRWRPTTEERVELLYDNSDLVPVLHELIFCTGQRVSKHMSFMVRSPVGAAVIATLRKSKQPALEFWQSVRTGEMLSTTSPAYKLREWLLRVALASGGGAKGDKEMVSRREAYVRCLVAWNAHRGGRGTSLRYHSNAELPLVHA